MGGEVDVPSGVPQGDVVIEAVPLPHDGADLQGQGVIHQGNVDPALEDSGVVVADLPGHLGPELVELRAHPVDDDVAADGVLAEQHPLRAAVDFNALHIEDVDQLAGAGAHLDAIDDHSHLRALRLLDVRVADAADVQGAGARPGGVHADIDIGRQPVKVPQGLRLELLDLLHAEGRHRNGHVLLRLLPPPGGDYHLLDQTGRILLLRPGRSRIAAAGKAPNERQQTRQHTRISQNPHHDRPSSGLSKIG